MRAVIFFTLFFLSCNESSKIDSIPIYELDNSTLIIRDGEDQFYLKRCEVRKRNDSLFFNFSDTVKQSNWYELQIIAVDNQFYPNCYSTFTVDDSSYKPPVLKNYYQSIQLDNTSYQKADSISGTVSLYFSSYYRWPRVFTDTIKIAGDFRAVIQ